MIVPVSQIFGPLFRCLSGAVELQLHVIIWQTGWMLMGGRRETGWKMRRCAGEGRSRIIRRRNIHHLLLLAWPDLSQSRTFSSPLPPSRAPRLLLGREVLLASHASKRAILTSAIAVVTMHLHVHKIHQKRERERASLGRPCSRWLPRHVHKLFALKYLVETILKE